MGTIDVGGSAAPPEPPGRSPVAVDHKIGDEGQQLALLRRGEDLQVTLGVARVAMRALERIVDAVVLEHEAPDLLDLRGLQRPPAQHRAHALGLRLAHALEHGDERQRALALAQVGGDGLAEPPLVGHEVQGVVVAPLRIGGGLAAAQRGLVHHVVVDQGGRVQQLDAAGEAHRAGPAIAGEARREQQQDGAQTLAAGARDVAAHLLDEADGGGELPPDLPLDGGEVVPDESGDALLEDLLERRRRHTAYFRTTRSRTCTSAPGATLCTSATENRSRISVTRAVATSSSSSPSSSPVTGCTIGIRSRRRLSMLPGRRPSRLVRSITMRTLSTYTT